MSDVLDRVPLYDTQIVSLVPQKNNPTDEFYNGRYKVNETIQPQTSPPSDESIPPCKNCDGSGYRPAMKIVCGCKNIDQRADMVTLVMTRSDASAIGKAGLILSDGLEISLFTMGFMPVKTPKEITPETFTIAEWKWLDGAVQAGMRDGYNCDDCPVQSSVLAKLKAALEGK